MDVLTPEQRRRNMQAIRNCDTKAEILLAKAIWKKGLRYRKNDKNVFGKPDLVLKRFRLAIFVDSEYFHGRDWETRKFRIKTNRDFWWNKIEGNIRRDHAVINKLSQDDWTVIRFWDTEVLKDVSFCVERIVRIVKNFKDET